MNKFEIRKEIAALIDSIKEHSDDIGDNKPVSQLELEVILRKIKSLYEKSIVFNYLNTVIETENNKSIAENITSSKEEPLKTEITHTPIDLFGSEMTPTNSKPKPEKKVEKKDEKALTGNLQSPPITDLKSAIGINDQFQFANELFAGSMKEYSIAIQQLNTAGTLESAIYYFSNLQQLYNWNSENETVKRLVNLVDRRYSA